MLHPPRLLEATRECQIQVNVNRTMLFKRNLASASTNTQGAETYIGQSSRSAIERGYGSSLSVVLGAWARQTSKPTVLLIDEIDSLIGDTLVSVLRQLRTGYSERPKNFPQSFILCGVRDIRDYRIVASKEKELARGIARTWISPEGRMASWTTLISA